MTVLFRVKSLRHVVCVNLSYAALMPCNFTGFQEKGCCFSPAGATTVQLGRWWPNTWPTAIAPTATGLEVLWQCWALREDDGSAGLLWKFYLEHILFCEGSCSTITLGYWWGWNFNISRSLDMWEVWQHSSRWSILGRWREGQRHLAPCDLTLKQAEESRLSKILPAKGGAAYIYTRSAKKRVLNSQGFSCSQECFGLVCRHQNLCTQWRNWGELTSFSTQIDLIGPGVSTYHPLEKALFPPKLWYFQNISSIELNINFHDIVVFWSNSLTWDSNGSDIWFKPHVFF